MAHISLDHLDVDADQCVYGRTDNHVVIVVPTQFAEAIKTAFEITAMMLLDPALHTDGDRKRMLVAVEDSINLARGAKELERLIADEVA